MKDYEPLDLAKWCNAKIDVLGPEAGVKPGLQKLRGLPFLLGGKKPTARAACLLAPSKAVTIPIGKAARRVVFAHRMQESNVPGGGPLGITVAEYVFRLAGGRTVRVPIRERFEIGPPGRPFDP